MRKEIALVGCGMGTPDTLTVEGKCRITQAEVLIGPERLVRPYADSKKEIWVQYQAEQIREIIDQSPRQRFAVLLSGDTGFYSNTRNLEKALEGYHTAVIPGISSLAYFSAKIGIPWEDAYILSLHGRKQSLATAVRKHSKVFVLTGEDAAEHLQGLAEAGFGSCGLWIGENLSYPEERISSGRVQDFLDKEFEPLCVFMILPEDEKGNRIREGKTCVGIPEEAFIRGNVPMTKPEIRAVVMSKLALKETDIVYDIGAGTGSVSVEMAMAADRGKVYAIECKPEAVELIKKNADHFGLRNLEIVDGMAPEALEGLPVPDAAFIGGSKGRLSMILASLFRQNPQMQVVMDAIALETVTEVLTICTQMQLRMDMVQVQVNKTRVAGNYHMMTGQNPVFIITVRKFPEL
ncbi:precorrin-6y C5,15-methyltransferase (decarboxylating) subunit CbiE [Diplocloster hominis]|uniref:precorrin-6y C5,15-methyltransferase (decarboxylating) subunit CbiE n=1 Tax=Diplocloster hominis TaxID=3079010 RepID=UPI0031BB812E